MAAVPFAIVMSWLTWAAWQQIAPKIGIVWIRLIPVAAAVLALGAFSGYTTIERNRTWDEATRPYEVLATGLKRSLPSVESHSRIIIYYGVWDGFALWPDAVVRTIYKDPTLDATNVARQNSEDFNPPRRASDIVVFYADGRFITVPYSAASAH